MVKAQAKEGLTQIKVTNLSKCVDPQTIRVLGCGAAIINEVNFTTRSVLEEYEGAAGKLEETKVRQQELLKEVADLDVKEHTINKQKEVLEAFANRIASYNSKNEEYSDVLNLSSLDTLQRFLPMYSEHSAKLSNDLAEVAVQRIELDKKLAETNAEIVRTDPTKDGIVSREVHILIETYEEEEITLLVSYVVTEAGWTPKYDLRVHSRDKLLKVLFFGVVSQNTGEDWANAKLSLSTALPSTGGLPTLGTHELVARQNNYHSQNSIKRPARGTSIRRKKSDKMIKVPTDAIIDEEDIKPVVMVNGLDKESVDNDFVSEFKDMMLDEVVQESKPAISTTYPVTTAASIPSDKAGHKVNIAIIDMQAEFSYASCPRVCPHAFLKIAARNDSAYALLGGPADIFLDGNFCSKTSMKEVCPTEEFELDVGSDPAIRVIYRPLLRHKESGSKTTIVSYTQDMDVKNTRNDPISIVVQDQLPKSNDDKVKVILHDPDVKKKKDNCAKINSNNNVEWNTDIPGSSTTKLQLRYTVEYPINMDVSGLI